MQSAKSSKLETEVHWCFSAISCQVFSKQTAEASLDGETIKRKLITENCYEF